MDPLDAIATSLRARLVGEADGVEGLPERIRSLVEAEAGMLDAASRAELERRVAERSFGLGPLEPLLADNAVDEIMVSGPGRVWVERRGRLEATEVAFGCAEDLRHAIERI